MVVLRNGQKVLDVPASYGLGSDPERNTRSGIHVVSEKFTDKRMVSQRYGYDVVEKWAVRISNNGEFIHANPASAAAQGSANVTHGCVNLSLDSAKAYYDIAQYGDPVEVTGTPVAARRPRRRHLGLDAVVGPVEEALSALSGTPGSPSTARGASARSGPG